MIRLQTVFRQISYKSQIFKSQIITTFTGMCGICGYYSTSGVFSSNDLEKMASSLQHRGPDAEGYFYHENIGLGHRRLSIIDLSSAANQPMHSHNGRYVMVYNGEVYNFKEIEKEVRIQNSEVRSYGSDFDRLSLTGTEDASLKLPTADYQLRTRSDSEVILEAFALWGSEFVNKLNGMFVIVIYDREENSFYIFRDRIGIKPLYYYWDGKHFAFASELKALKKCEFINKNISLNYTAVNEYLHLGYIPEPNTVYDKIYKFPAGCWGKVSSGSQFTVHSSQFTVHSSRFDTKIGSGSGSGSSSGSGNLVIKKYWNIDDKISDKLITDENEAKGRLKELLVSSIKYRMISDVPFGTFLSGGIDSSLVTAIAQSVSSEPVKTFTIGFKEATHDESHYAKAVAEYLGTKHHEYILTEKDAMDMIPELSGIYDEPFADSSAIPTLLVSKMARQNVTMTLSGDGGDELFMGYGAYKWVERLNNPLIKIFRAPIKASLSSSSSSRHRRASHLFENVPADQLCSHIFSQEQLLFSRSEIKKLLNPEFYKEFKLDETPALSRKLSPAEKQSLFDLKYYLKDDLLVKVDRASMHYSLETRVPLLDYRIVEFAYNLHPSLRSKNGVSKYLLKKVLFDYVPEKYFDRPKWGFAIPLNKWMKKDIKSKFEESLSKNDKIINMPYLNSIIEKYRNGKNDYLYNMLWQVMMLNNLV
jgi:asparagine synthase (glutamine-hydrolysing)